MDGTDSTPSPVIQELTTILRDACPDLEDWGFKFCVAKADTSRKRCKKPLGSKHSGQAEDLWRQFGLMNECPETNEFLDQVAGFLTVSHCSSHKRNANENLEKWKKGRVTTVSSLPVQLLTIHDSYDRRVTTTMAFDAAAPTLRMGSTLGTSIEGEKFEAFVHITAATNTTSIKATTTNSLSTTNDLVNDTIAATERIIGHGLVSLQQNEPQKNHALVLLEMQKPPTPEQAKRGVVIVQEHELGNGLFKIGWMDGTARDTIGHSDSCNTINSDVIYETPSGPFFAASKVKNLAHIALSPYNTRVMGFQQCGPEYDGWLSAPVETVLQTVKTMEAFVQLPAYESKDGQNWELSLAADEIIRTMGDFPLERLKDTMESTDKASAGKVTASLATQSSQETATCVAETAASPISLESEEGLEGTRTATTPKNMGFMEYSNLKKKSRTDSAKKKVKKLFGSVASVVPWSRSQESTPER